MLFAQFPDLKEFVKPLREFQREGDLFIEVPCPFAAELEWPLRIWTERGREVGVGLDAYHTHFRSAKDSCDSECFGETLSFLQNIFTERIVVVSFVSNGRLAGSCSCSPEEIQDEILETPPGTLVRIRSWKGTYLKDQTQ